MSIYSTLGKYFLALTATGGGVAGTYFGITKSKWREEGSATSISVPENSEDNDLTQLNNRGKGSESSDQKNQDINPSLEPSVEENLSQSESLSTEYEEAQRLDSSLQNSNEEGYSVAEVQPSPIQEREIQSPTPNSSDEVPNQRELEAESLTDKGKASGNKNWFSIDLSDVKIFDRREWSAINNDCEKEIKGEEAIFKCHWGEGSSKTIELHLFLSSDQNLIGKNWDNVEELDFVPSDENSATLGLVFSDSPSREIKIFLDGRKP